MQYTWNVHSAACQWYLSETGSTLHSSEKHFRVGFLASSSMIQQQFTPSGVTTLQAFSLSFLQPLGRGAMHKALWEAKINKTGEVPTCMEQVLGDPGVISCPLAMASDGEGPKAKGTHMLRWPDIGPEAWEGFSVQVIFQLGTERCKAALARWRGGRKIRQLCFGLSTQAGTEMRGNRAHQRNESR